MIWRPADPDRSHRLAGALPLATGLVLLAVATRSTLQGMGQPIGPHDEGLLLTNAMLMAQGYVPYRDFYTNYPPGIYLAIIALWKIFGVSVTAERIVGLAAHLVLALVAGRFAGVLCGKRFSTLTAGMVLLWLAWLGTVAFAWLVALGLAMIGGLLLLRALERPTPWSWLLVGAAFGLVGCFRHDLLIYVSLSLLGLGLSASFITRAWRPNAGWLQAGGWTLFGAIVPLALVWGPALARSGVIQPVEDTYFVLVRQVMRARDLPLPPLLDIRPTVPEPLWAPVVLMHSFEGAVAPFVPGGSSTSR